MKNALVFLVAGMLSGCGQPPVPASKAERVADGKADALAGNMWGKIEYAPKQYVGFAYDSTGVYGNLHGENPPELIRLTLSVSRDGKGSLRKLYLPSVALIGGSPAGSTAHLVVPDVELKWLGRPLMAKRAFVYGRTFWIPWRAFELAGPPADGKVRISVHAMQRKGTGARFLLGENTAH